MTLWYLCRLQYLPFCAMYEYRNDNHFRLCGSGSAVVIFSGIIYFCCLGLIGLAGLGYEFLASMF